MAEADTRAELREMAALHAADWYLSGTPVDALLDAAIAVARLVDAPDWVKLDYIDGVRDFADHLTAPART